MTILTQEFVFTALEAEKSGEQFPIDFDDVWNNLGYTRKNDAYLRLKQTHDYDVDFTDLGFAANSAKPQGGRPSRIIRLTIDGFKSFCMVAETPEGREVRKYFIEVEKTYRQQLERQLLATPDPRLESLQTQVFELNAKLNYLKGQRDNYYDQLQTYKAKERAEKEETKIEAVTFSRNFIDVHYQMQYHSKNYLFFDVMLELLKLREGVDYIFDGKKFSSGKKTNYQAIKMSELAYQAIITWGRSKKGMQSTADTPRELTVKRSFLTNHATSKNSANTFQPKN